jgi:hypothetical protein
MKRKKSRNREIYIFIDSMVFTVVKIHIAVLRGYDACRTRGCKATVDHNAKDMFYSGFPQSLLKNTETEPIHSPRLTPFGSVPALY